MSEYTPQEKILAHRRAKARAEEHIIEAGMAESKKDKGFGSMFSVVLLSNIKFESKIKILTDMLKYQLSGEKEKVSDIYFKLFQTPDEDHPDYPIFHES